MTPSPNCARSRRSAPGPRATSPGARSQAQLRARAERWRPWRAYAALHLWAAGAALAASSGQISASKGAKMSAKPPETFLLDRLQTPIGPALLVSDADGMLRALDWEDHSS